MLCLNNPCYSETSGGVYKAGEERRGGAYVLRGRTCMWVEFWQWWLRFLSGTG